VQSCPVLSKIDHIERSTHTSRSASANTTLADFPPSSSETRVIVSAHRAMICDPTPVEPVNPTFATLGSDTRAFPTVEPGPGSTLIVSGGSPASTSRSASFSTDSGV
jgi:hypothetical protein